MSDQRLLPVATLSEVLALAHLGIFILRKVFFGHGPQIPLREGLWELSHVLSDFKALLILGLPLIDRVSRLLLLQTPQKGLVLKGDPG